MRLPVTFVLGLFLLSCGGGGGSPASIPRADACTQGAQSLCTKLFSCQGDANLSLIQLFLGGSVATCETTIQPMYCAGFECTSADAYHGDKAAACKSGFGAVSCATLAMAAAGLNASNFSSAATILAGSVPPCQQICTAADAGATGG